MIASFALSAGWALVVPDAALAAKTVTVAATNDAWIDTGVHLSAGQHATLTVSGDASCGPGSDCPAGSTTGAGTTCAGRTLGPLPPGPAPNVNYGAIGARLGSSGAAVMVGSKLTVTGPGELYVVYEDCAGYYNDNSGSFTVQITTTPLPQARRSCSARKSRRSRHPTKCPSKRKRRG
jgi:hypothetical protein